MEDALMPDAPLPRDRAKAHWAWRRKVNNHLPAVAGRVFALRSRAYMGCGFHYAMEQRLGKILAWANDYDQTPTFAGSIIEEVVWEEFLRDLIRAEFSARGWDFPDRRSRIAA
jgi:hypothetical protein